jgi:hypothetical protein
MPKLIISTVTKQLSNKGEILNYIVNDGQIIPNIESLDSEYLLLKEWLKSNSAKEPYSVEEIASIEQQIIEANSRKYLQDTDWYVVRNIETGKAIPDEVTTKRVQSRLLGRI